MIRTLCTVFALTLALMSGVAAAENWRRIGSATYDTAYHKAVIDVGTEDGRFEAIRLDIQGFDVEVRAVKIVYGNGDADDVPVGAVFKAGTRSRRIDLKRGDRFIKRVIISYRAPGAARVVLLGDMADNATAWEVLGCKAVDFNVERDVIKVDHREGTFTRLKVSVEDNPVEFYEVRVVYGNGQPDVLKLRAVLKPRQESLPLDLAGGSRSIDHIELVYRSMKAFTGRAKVCASGLHTR